LVGKQFVCRHFFYFFHLILAVAMFQLQSVQVRLLKNKVFLLVKLGEQKTKCIYVDDLLQRQTKFNTHMRSSYHDEKSSHPCTKVHILHAKFIPTGNVHTHMQSLYLCTKVDSQNSKVHIQKTKLIPRILLFGKSV
jgi:hypothetical protein